MTVDAKALERALRRYWFTHQDDDGVPLTLLPQYTRNLIVAEAVKIEGENRETDPCNC